MSRSGLRSLLWLVIASTSLPVFAAEPPAKSKAKAAAVPTKKAAPATQGDVRRGETRALMDAMFVSLSEVLPLSFNSTQFNAKANRAKITARLSELTKSAQKLEQYSAQFDPGFGYVSRSLARDTTSIEKYFKTDRHEEARFLLGNLTENCISCHSKLGETLQFSGAKDLFKNTNVAGLADKDRLRLLIATRQFDAALQTYESHYEARATARKGPFMLDDVDQYLNVAIRVKKDSQRPLSFFKKMRDQPQLATSSRDVLDVWIKSLSTPDPSGTAIEQAKKHIEDGKDVMTYPSDKRGIVYYTRASAVLLNYINAAKSRDESVAEAYYLLGVCEAMTSHSLWLSQSEFYLESAIRIAPKTVFAKEAYSMLEEQIILGYTGSSGTNIPEDVQDNLIQLKGLLK